MGHMLPVDCFHTGAQFCAAIPDNFTAMSEIQNVNTADLVGLPSDDLDFVEWIFPNSLKFPCSGRVRRWIFRAETVDLNIYTYTPPGLLWRIYTEHPISPGFIAKATNGIIRYNLTELSSGVYQYLLEPPVEVEVGDIVGIVIPFVHLSTTLRPSFTVGQDLAESYRHPGPNNYNLIDPSTPSVVSDTQHFPVVTAIMGRYGLVFMHICGSHR